MLSAARNIPAPPLGGEGHEVARGCAAASEVSDSLVGKYQSAGRHQTVRRQKTVFLKARGKVLKFEMLLTVLSSLSQEESRSISENVTWGLRKSSPTASSP